ncbi:MAG TPA: hypothetical protein VJZ00_15360, partial [Thermoanaerobaculia bacterium]|nr:hypothetical protein [Thermoanaerobaculia bacterium]
KAAIVSSSLALDGDVMIFGAGRASATNAPSIATLPMPSLVNFGQDDTRQNLWTASREVTLRNLTNATQTLRANIAGARDGVTVHVTPDEVTLAAGETKNVRVEINVDNALVPSPVKGSLSYGGRIEWTGGATPLHVPWAFVKAAYLTIENPDGGTAYAAVMGPSGKTIVFDFLDAARVFRPIEKVDVLVAQFEYPPRVAIAEQVSVEANAVASVHLNDAQLTATATTTDEAGNDLASYTRECHEKIVLGFPSGGKVSFESAPDTRALFAPFSSRIRMYLAHTCGDASASTLYAAMHPPIDGLSQSITSTLHPRWLRQDVRFTPELPKSETMISALAMMRFPGTDESFYYDGGSWFLMRGTGSTLKVFFTPSPTPDASFVTMMDWYGKCDVPGLANKADCAFVDNVFFYLDEQHVTAETDLFLEVSPMGYRTPTGEPVTFGRAPVSPQVRFDADKSGYGVVVFWMGPLGERRIGDTADAHVAIYDASGTLLHADYVGFGVDTPLAPGRYRIESVDPDLVAGDVRGTATFTAWLDTSRNDFLIPMFTGLRIVDENERQVSVLDRGAHASLVFSAADQVRGNVIWWERVPPAEEATRVEYRAHGTTEWHPLTATLTARHYPYSVFLNGGVGTMYRADLTSIASSMIGGVDLRVFVEDKAGNSSELRLEPAFVVGESAKRRAVAR